MKNNLENIICSAYTFIEFKGSINVYCNDSLNAMEGMTRQQLQECWDQVYKDYDLVSEYMTDDAIKQAQRLVMQEF